ncbi:Hypothetical protein LUCI_4760 [Lucifera butyrica]|uniref:Uncharacterized protein n=2 Tax=Lucifera butyrica TaxID=1351585 RepID=A0A498REM8_9FIRM|nr:Hypothetical protein LUCI_4760 [Lucifera butyrica]
MTFGEKLLAFGGYTLVMLAVSAFVWFANFHGIVSYPVLPH